MESVVEGVDVVGIVVAVVGVKVLSVGLCGFCDGFVSLLFPDLSFIALEPDDNVDAVVVVGVADAIVTGVVAVA